MASTASASTRTQQTDAHLIGELDTLFQDARSRRRPMVSRWLRNYAIVNSRPWSASRASWKPAPDVPEIFPILSARVAWVRETTPQFDAMPVSDPNSAFYDFYLDLGNDLKITMNSCWDEQRFDPELERMLWDVQMYGTGISKTLWDPTAVDGLGNVTMKRVDPFCFYPDPDAHSLDDANYMFEVQRISIAELDRRFPGAAGQLVGGDGTESLPDDSPSQLGDRGQGSGGLEPLGRSGKNPAGNDTNPRWSLTTEKSAPFRSATDHVVVYYAWLRETSDARVPELELAADPTTPRELLDEDEERRRLLACQRWQRLKFDAGYAMINWPVELGGRGLPNSYVRAFLAEESRYVVPSAGELPPTSMGLTATTIAAYGTAVTVESID